MNEWKIIFQWIIHFLTFFIGFVRESIGEVLPFILLHSPRNVAYSCQLRNAGKIFQRRLVIQPEN